MNTTKKRIEKIVNNGYQLDFGTVFEQAFENYKKIAIYAGSMLLIFSFVLILVLAGIAISVFGIGVVLKYISPENLNPENFKGNFLLIYTGCVTLITCLISPFQAGFLKMADCGERGEEFHISTMFEYYKAPYFGSVVSATFLIALLSPVLSTVLDQEGMPIIGMLLSIAISLLTFLTIPLIVFGNLNSIEAIKSSIQIVIKQPLMILALIIVSAIAAMTGLIGFCIGIFFTIPFIYSMQYSIYNLILGIDYSNEIDQLGSNI
jgi:MFS family permease